MMRSLIVIGFLMLLMTGAFSRWDSRRMKTNPEEPPCPNCIKEPPGARRN